VKQPCRLRFFLCAGPGALAPVLAPGKVIHVFATKGSDQGDGSAEAAFKSLPTARDAIRAIKKTGGLPAGGIEVRINAGHYRPGETLRLTAEDSGTPQAPIVWRGVDRERVIFSGGTPLNPALLAPLASFAAQERLHPDARGNVLGMDLLSIDCDAVFGGKGSYGQLSMNGHLLQLARWPNRGYHQTDKFVDKGPATRWLKPGEEPMPYSVDNPTGGKFTFQPNVSPAVAAEFAKTKDMRIEGYFHNDWYWQNEPVGAIRGEEVQLLHHTRYGIADHIKGMPRRVRMVNVLAELDEPGEWYFDRQLKVSTSGPSPASTPPPPPSPSPAVLPRSRWRTPNT
jgi:hypothetical protein